MALIGVIEAELQASSREKAGGFGPLFQKTWVRTPFRTGEFLSRTLRAFQKLGTASVASLFAGDEDLLAGLDDEEVAIGNAIDLVEGLFDDDVADFSIMLTHTEDGLAYVTSVEGSAEHELGDPALAVLVNATVAEPEESDREPSEVDDADEMYSEQDEERQEEGPDDWALLEAFLHRLQGELDRELALLEPDVRIWEEDTPDPADLRAGPSVPTPWAG